MPVYEMAYDLTGKVFGHLTVLKYLNRGLWQCLCDCASDRFIEARSDRLRSGMTFSCGCVGKNAHLKKKWNPIEIDEHTYGIPLSQDQTALIDKEDFDRIKNISWYAQFHKKRNVFYAVSKFGLMHKFLICPPEGADIDHKDRNTLNNRRSNLRICTRTQNNMNRPKQKNNSTGFKGVTVNQCGNFLARITINKKIVCLGTYKTPEEASQAYIKAAKKLQGDFYPKMEDD